MSYDRTAVGMMTAAQVEAAARRMLRQKGADNVRLPDSMKGKKFSEASTSELREFLKLNEFGRRYGGA